MADPLTFGALLRRYRKQTLDPHTQGPLSQMRLAEEVHQSTATISYWETDQRRIDVQDRATLLLLLEMLSRHGGIRSVAEANALLEAGDYRALNAAESVRFQPFYLPSQEPAAEPVVGQDPEPPPETAEPPPQHISLDWLAVLFRSDAAPDESRLAALVINWLGYPVELITPEGALRLMGLGALWVVAAWLWLRLFHWPYADQTAALRAVLPWVAASTLIPMVLGLIIRADRQGFLEQKTGKRSYLLFHRVVGAILGYTIGAGFVFVIGLALYYAGFWPPARSITMALAVVPLLLSYAAGRRTPYNSFRAYHDSRGEADALKPDRWSIVFVFSSILALILLAGLIYFAPDIIFHPIVGPLLLIFACAMLAISQIYDRGRDPNHMGLFVYGPGLLVAILYGLLLMTYSGLGFLVGIGTIAASVIILLLLLNPDTRYPKLIPLLVWFSILLLEYLLVNYNLLWGRIMFFVSLVLWLIIYRRNFRTWLPLILTIILMMVSVLLYHFQIFPLNWIRLGYALAAAGLVVWQLRRARSKE